MSHSLQKGTEIRCPRKRHIIGTLSRTLNAGEPLNVSRIEFAPGQERVAGEVMSCKICSSLYYVQSKLYTDSGWQPSEPSLEPVARK